MNSRPKPIRVLQLGLGPIGVSSAELVLQRDELELVGAVDYDPQKAGRTVGELIGSTSCAVPIVADLAAALGESRPDVVLQTTGSRLPQVADQLKCCIRGGASVVSSCEELLYPWYRHADLAEELDTLARARGIRVLGTGVNPGFVMDLIPVVVSASCKRIESVYVERVVDASTRRGPLQRKVGAGMDASHFRELAAEGKIGHVGSCESASLILRGLGWRADSLTETIEPVIADRMIQTDFVRVEPGHVAGIHQIAVATRDDAEIVRLDLKMYVGAKEPHDRVRLAADPPMDVLFEGGVAGESATIANLINTVPRLIALQPGIRTVLDLPAAAGGRV